MLILVIIFVFFILHIQFLCEVIFFGRNTFSFFYWDFIYPYSVQIAIRSLKLVCLCLFFFLLGYFILHKKKNINIRTTLSNKGKSITIFNITFFFYIAFILLGIYILMVSNFSYSKITKARENLNFIFELRIIPLLLTSYILMNSNPDDWKKRRLKRLRIILVLYIIILLLLQTRSIIFEFGIIIIYYWIRLINDRFKIRYIFYFYAVSLIPNILLLFRMGVDFTDINIYQNIFVYEYSLLFNNILSEVISHVGVMKFGETFSDIGGLLIPSFLRNLFGINLTIQSFRDRIARDAGVSGGGFSFIAELYLDFGSIISIVLFLLLGMLLSFLHNKILYRTRVSMIYAGTPLFYCYFLLAFRNGATIFIKQSIQLFITVCFFYFILNVRYKPEKKVYTN